MEVVQGEEIGDHGIIFKRVGSELPVVEGGFTITVPSQALAISNKFGLTFFLHPEGFCLAKTQDLVQASQTLVNSDEDYNAKDNALANIELPCAQLLALSEDELVVAACTEDKVNFYSVPALLQKGREGSENGTALLKSLSMLDVECSIKVFAWNPVQRGVILILSKGGELTVGLFTEQHLKVVAEDVEGVDWSPDGEYFCYITRDKNLHICHSKLFSRSSSRLPPEMFREAQDGGLEAYVDALNWARLDSILVSCVGTDDDAEDNSWIFVLASKAGPISKDLHNTKIVSFEGFFTSIDSSIVPCKTGPYTLSNYIQPWELLIVTSRRCVDDHISLLGWFEELGKSEVYKFDLVDDRFTPRIELQASGDDNSVVGLSVDKTTESIQIPAPNDDSGEKLKPGPVLFCMTKEGNLSLFSIARMPNKVTNMEVLNAIAELPEASEVLLYYSLDSKVSGTTVFAVEGSEHKSKPSVTLAQKNGLGLDNHGGKASVNESWPDKSMFAQPKGEITDSMQLKKHPTTKMEGATVKKQDSSKELKTEEIQTGQKVIHIQRQAQVPVEANSRPVSSVYTKTSSTTALTEMESEVVRELNKVKDMATEIERLMDFIQGKGRLKKGELEPCFTKTYVEGIESKTRTMYKQCESFREQLVEQRRDIVDLRDESLQVDAWRVYVQSILEQAFDVRYKDLWSKQTLHPELAGMRKRILQADQSLKQQIAKLEEHLHNLELYEWQKKKQPRIPPALSRSKNFGCIQSLYDTVNTQMVVAQQLARRLALQSEALKLTPVAQEEMESSTNISMLKLQNMTLQDHPVARTKARLSSSGHYDFSPVRTNFRSSLQTPSKQVPPAGTRVGLQDSTRRRRDSVDKLWVDVGAAKTTVKRAAPAKRFDGISSPSRKDVVQEEEASSSVKDYIKPGTIDTGTVQSMQQKMAQIATPATTTFSTSLPSTTAPSTAKDQVSVGLTSMSQKTSREQESQTVFFPNQVTYMGLSSIGSPTQNTTELKVKHIETPSNMDVGKREMYKIPTVTSGNHEKISSRKSPVTSINESEKKEASINLQSKPTVKQQQGALRSSFNQDGSGINQDASQIAGSNLMRLANLQAHSTAAHPSVKPEIKASDNIRAIEWSKGNIEGYTVKLSTAVETVNLLTSSSSASGDMISSLSSLEQSSGPLFSLQREALPNATGQREALSNSTGQGQGPSVVAATSLAQPLSPEPTPQPWGSSSAESPLSLSTKLSNFMPALSSALESSSAPTKSSVALPSAAGACSQTSPSIDLPSISSTRPLNVFDNSVMPAEKLHFPSTSSVSTSFLPVQGPPTLSDEDEMEEEGEEGDSINSFESSSFAVFGLGSSSSSPFGLQSSLPPAESKPSSPFGAPSLWSQSSPSSLSVPTGQLFKPASFSIPTPQSTAPSATSTLFGNNLTSAVGGFVSSPQPSTAFGNLTQPSSSGQQALGSALGSFGQTRQIGGPFSVSASPSGYGFTTSGGFASASTTGGFESAATSGGFASVASGGGFAGIAASGGFASAATGSGFAGFSGAGVGGSASSTPGGFGAFSGGAFSAFGGNKDSSIFTQMRK